MVPLPAGETHRQSMAARRRLVAGAAGTAAVLLAVAGCRVPGLSSVASGPAVSATITVSALPGPANAPLYIGIRDGLFRRQGLTVKVHPSGVVANEVSQLQSGRTDIAFADYADMFYARETSDKHLVVDADAYDCAANVVQILTLPQDHITTPQNLRNKIIGTASPQELPTGQGDPYSLETTAAWSVLGNVNENLPKSIHWDPMPEASLISALQIHQVDAILTTEPVTYQAESQLGAIPVADGCTGATENLPLDGYFSNSAWALAHENVVKAFRTALYQAQADAAVNSPVQTALMNAAQMPPQEAAMINFGTYPTGTLAQNLQRVATLMFFYNALPQSLLVGHMIAP